MQSKLVAIAVLVLMLFPSAIDGASSPSKTASPASASAATHSQTNSGLSSGNQAASPCGQGGACVGADSLSGQCATEHLTPSSHCGFLAPHGNGTMHYPKNFLIFWNPPGYKWNQTEVGLITQYFHGICETQNAFYDILRQYDAAGACSFGDNATGIPTSNSTYATLPLINQSQIEDVINDTMNSKGWVPNRTDGNNTFFLFTPPRIIAQGFTLDFCGYHSVFPRGRIPVVYAFIPYPGRCLQDGWSAIDHVIDTASHEQFESVTDVLDKGWYFLDGKHEMGDQCAYVYSNLDNVGDGATVNISGHRYRVQSEWSNRDNGCTYGGPSILAYGRPRGAVPTPVTVCQAVPWPIPVSVFPDGYPEPEGYSLPNGYPTLSLGVVVQSGSGVTFSLNRTSAKPPFFSTLNLTVPSPGTYNVTIIILPDPYFVGGPVEHPLLIRAVPHHSPDCDLWAGTWSVNFTGGYDMNSVFTTYTGCADGSCIAPYGALVKTSVTGEGYWFFEQNGPAALATGQADGALIGQLTVSLGCIDPKPFVTSFEETWSASIGASVSRVDPATGVVTGVITLTIRADYGGYSLPEGYDHCDYIPASLTSPPSYLEIRFPDLNAFENTGKATPLINFGREPSETFVLKYYPRSTPTPSPSQPPTGPDIFHCLQNPTDISCWSQGPFGAVVVVGILTALPILVRRKLLRRRRKTVTIPPS